MAGTGLAIRGPVRRFAPYVKVFVFLIPLAVCAGRMRANDFPTTQSELNRCLAALRAVCARRIRSPHHRDEQPASASGTQPLQRLDIQFRLHLR
jgi:hypothetical protein